MRIPSLPALYPLLSILKPYRWGLAGAFAALSIAAGAVISIGWGLRHVVDNATHALDERLINAGFLFLLGVAAVLAGASFARSALGMWVSERAVADVKEKVFYHFLQLDRAFYDQARVGELLARLQADLTLIQTLLSASLSTGMRSLIQLLGTLALLFMTSAKLFGLVLLLLPVTLVPLILLGARVQNLARAAQSHHGDTAAFLEEALSAVTTYQAYGNEALGTTRFGSFIRQALQTSRRRIFARGILVACVMMMVASGVSFILWIGIRDVLEGRLTAGEMMAFVFYAVVAAGSLNSLTEMWGDLQNASGAGERLWELLATESKIRTPVHPSPFPGFLEQIRFENVSFAYPLRPDVNVLEGFSLTLKAGESVAIVGPSGAGKSTVFHLLMRFYDPSAGSITVNGQDIQRFTLKDVRHHVGWLSQEPVIFASTVYDNIRFGRLDAEACAIEAAARAAQAYDFIQALPQGFQTELGERGVRLSGGQRQRIALARVLLKNPAFLLLDEATNAVDSESEALIQKALDHLMRGRTTVMIAHRLSTAMKAQRIIVIEHGKITGDGTHQQLLDTCDWYRRFVALQGGSTILKGYAA